MHLRNRPIKLLAICLTFMLLGLFPITGAKAGLDPKLIEAAKKEGVVNWGTGMTRPYSEALQNKFQDKFGIKVNLTRIGTEALLGRFMMEMDSGVCEFDLLTTGKPPTGKYLEKKWVAKYESPSLERMSQRTIKDVYHDPQGFWTPTLIDLQLISYNSKSIPEADAPKNWTDLLDPRYKDKLAHADPRYSGTAMLTVAALSQFYGWDYYAKLGKNNPMITRGHGALVEIMITGERPVAAEMLLLTVAKPIKAGEPIKNIFPADGTVPTPWQTFLSASVKHPNAAKLFLEYFLSDEVQKYCAENWLLYPVIEGLPNPPGFPKLADIKLMPVDLERVEKEDESIKNKFWDNIE